MLRQAENKIRIEGILSEINLKYGSYVRDGKTIDNIGGTIKVLVSQEVNGENVEHFYQFRLGKHLSGEHKLYFVPLSL